VQFEQTWRTLNNWSPEAGSAEAIAIPYSTVPSRAERRRPALVLTQARQRRLTHALMLALALGVAGGGTMAVPQSGAYGEGANSEGVFRSLLPDGAIVSGVVPETLPSSADHQRQIALNLAVPANEPKPAKPAPEIKTYVVQDGDNPFDLSNKFGITDETLLAANGLGPDSVLQIGQRLLIPPVSGVVVSTQPGDTPKAIADQWKIDLGKLISVNRLAAGVNTLLSGEPLVIPDAMPPVQIWPQQGNSDDAAADPKASLRTDQPAPAPRASARAKAAPAPILPPVITRPAVRRTGSNNFPWGQCTWWAANERPDIGSAVVGNAASWLYSARAAGLATGTVPRVGAVVVYQPGAQGAAWTGHVAYVTSVSGSSFTISEMNFPIWGGVTHRTSWTGPGVAFIY
jgi:surface antigen